MKGWIKEIVIAVALGFLVLQMIKPTIVKEHSMEPTLHENDYIFLSKQAYRFGSPGYGDIIVFHTNLVQQNGKEKLLIKRIVGKEGDVISISDGEVYRNGVALQEDYTLDGYTFAPMEKVTVPEGKLFVMGDNRQNSIDSRDINVGFLEEDKIVGQAVFRLYPFKEMGRLR